MLSTVPGITLRRRRRRRRLSAISINLRGYSANNDITVDGVRDSAQYTRFDPFNLEQIEITNGANSVYSGAGSVGGTINIVTKRPTARNSRPRSAPASAPTTTIAAPSTPTTGVNDGVAVRLNAMVHRNDAPGRDVEENSSAGAVAPSITFGLGRPDASSPPTTCTSTRRTTSGRTACPSTTAAPVPGVDPSNYYGYANLDVQEQDLDTLTGILEHKFGGGLKIRNLTRYQEVKQYIAGRPAAGRLSA